MGHSQSTIRQYQRNEPQEGTQPYQKYESQSIPRASQSTPRASQSARPSSNIPFQSYSNTIANEPKQRVILLCMSTKAHSQNAFQWVLKNLLAPNDTLILLTVLAGFSTPTPADLESAATLMLRSRTSSSINFGYASTANKNKAQSIKALIQNYLTIKEEGSTTAEKGQLTTTTASNNQSMQRLLQPSSTSTASFASAYGASVLPVGLDDSISTRHFVRDHIVFLNGLEDSVQEYWDQREKRDLREHEEHGDHRVTTESSVHHACEVKRPRILKMLLGTEKFIYTSQSVDLSCPILSLQTGSHEGDERGGSEREGNGGDNGRDVERADRGENLLLLPSPNQSSTTTILGLSSLPGAKGHRTVGQVIVEMSECLGVDLLVLGASAKQSAFHRLVRSVSEYCLWHCNRPLLLIKEQAS